MHGKAFEKLIFLGFFSKKITRANISFLKYSITLCNLKLKLDHYLDLYSANNYSEIPVNNSVEILIVAESLFDSHQIFPCLKKVITNLAKLLV